MSNTPPVIGQDPWGEDLNSYLAWLEGRLGTVEEGQGTTDQQVTTVSATSYTLSAVDAGDLIRVTGTAPTITLPSGGGLTVGQRVEFLCISAPVTFVLGSGAAWDVTPASTTVVDSGAFVVAVKMSATTWALMGQLVYVAQVPPTLTSFTPANISTHYGPTTLTMTGTGFTASAKVRVEGIEIPTTYVSSSTVTAVYDAAGHATGTVDVDVTQASGATGTKPMRIADFLVTTEGVVGFSLFYSFDAGKHNLTRGTYSGTILFTGATQVNSGEQISIAWGGDGSWMGAPFSMTLDADKTMCSASVASVSGAKLKALPADTVYTFNAVPRFNMVFTSHTHAEIGLDPVGSTTGANYTVFLDPSTVPGSTWDSLHTPGTRIHVPFAFSTTMTGGGTGWLGSDGGVGSSEHVLSGAYWSTPLHPGYGGARKGEMGWLEGKTVDVTFDPTLPNYDSSSGRHFTPWKLSDPQTELVYGISTGIPGFTGTAAAGWPYVGTGLVAWKTSDPPKTMYLRRHPSDTRTTTYTTDVKCFDDVTSTWKALYKSDLTTPWTKTEIAAMINMQVTLSRDASGVLVLAPVSVPTSVAWHSSFWASDPWWTPPANGVAISTGAGGGWRDGSGNGHNMTTVAGGPIYRSGVSGVLNVKPTIQFDGVDDRMNTSNFAAVNSPVSMVFVIQIPSVGVNNAKMIGGAGNGGGPCFGTFHSKWLTEMFLQGTEGGTVTNNSSQLVYVLFGVGGGSNVDFYVNGVLVYHPAVSTSTMPPTSWLLGDGTSSPPRPGSFYVAFAGFKSGALTTQEHADLLAWSRSFYGTP